MQWSTECLKKKKEENTIKIYYVLDDLNVSIMGKKGQHNTHTCHSSFQYRLASVNVYQVIEVSSAVRNVQTDHLARSVAKSASVQKN